MSEWGFNPWYVTEPTPYHRSGSIHVVASQRDMEHSAFMYEMMARRAREEAAMQRTLDALQRMSAVTGAEVRDNAGLGDCTAGSGVSDVCVVHEMTPDEVWSRLAARKHVDEDTAKKIEAAGQSWDDYWADAG